jgi:hypothetical protein
MDPKDLFSILKIFYLNNPDLMRHLHSDACWEYVIYQNSLKEEKVLLHYFLYKKDDNNLEITQKDPDILPDLILYFTENSILELIQNNPIAEIYYERYHKMMQDGSHNKVDSKINKSRFNLLRLGYQKWQRDFKF